jgi:hypothetical protein
LEAVFQHAWDQVNPAPTRHRKHRFAPPEVQMTIEMILHFLDKDEQLHRLFLLEGRRIQDDGKQVVLVPGFWNS